MIGETEKTKNLSNTRQSGFVELIVTILIILIIMKLMGVTVSEVIFWFKSFFADVLR